MENQYRPRIHLLTLAGAAWWWLHLYALVAWAQTLPPGWEEGLAPGVNLGIAAQFPNDAGITRHPDVIAAEDFEDGRVRLKTRDDRLVKYTQVTSDVVFLGKYAGKTVWQQGEKLTSCPHPLPKPAKPEQHPAYFLRIYYYYDPSWHPGNQTDATGVKGIGIYNQRIKSGANDPCTGQNWYGASVQFVGWGGSGKPQANNGHLFVGHLYSYNPDPTAAKALVGDQVKVSRPATGAVPYRFSAYAKPFEFLKYGRWYCYEVGLYLNTPGKNDGEARFWIDGVLQSRVVNMRFRDIEDMYPTEAAINIYRTTDKFAHPMIRYMDNIVIARRYIGPAIAVKGGPQSITQYRQASEAATKARALLQEGRLAQALKLLNQVASMQARDEQDAELKKLIDQSAASLQTITDQARAELKQAETLAGPAAHKAYEDLAKKYAGTPWGVEAGKAQVALQLLQQAQKHEQAQQWRPAVSQYEKILKQYNETPSASAARQALAKLSQHETAGTLAAKALQDAPPPYVPPQPAAATPSASPAADAPRTDASASIWTPVPPTSIPSEDSSLTAKTDPSAPAGPSIWDQPPASAAAEADKDETTSPPAATQPAPANPAPSAPSPAPANPADVKLPAGAED